MRRENRGRVSTAFTDLVVFSGVDPKSAEWPAIFDATMCAPVDYTHVPGREWIVRDYTSASI